MGEQKWEVEEMKSLEEKKWEGHGCSEEAVVYTRAKHTYVVWRNGKSEHMVSEKNGRGAPEDFRGV